MVICEVSERERERHQNQKVGAMANHKERKTRPLHNFDLPRLKLGTHKTLRCMKINSTPSLGLAVSAGGERLGFDRISSPSKVQGVIRNLLEQRRRSPPPPKGSSSGVFRKPSPPIGGFGFGGGKLNINKGVFCDDGIDQVRKGEQRMKLPPPPHHPISEEEEEEEEEEETNTGGAPSNDAARPWNLRTRRAVCKAPNQISAAAVGGASSKLDQRQPHQHLSSSLTSETPSLKYIRFRAVSAAAAVTNVGGVEKEQRRKFSTLLARDEIEEDFWVMTGARPSRRPKKRPKLVQKQLDLLFPGLWLSEITVDSYRLPDDTEPKKKAVEKNSRMG